jgi:hypothetical protein
MESEQAVAFDADFARWQLTGKRRVLIEARDSGPPERVVVVEVQRAGSRRRKWMRAGLWRELSRSAQQRARVAEIADAEGAE